MSKTFQEIEISNGSWIKEQSDQINIFNDIKLIDFSEDTFRLFDAMIFTSYYASSLMHALNFLKQSLEYRDYWERSIDYAIANINLKEYNFKAKDGIETFILLWNIVSNKSFESNEFKENLIAKIIDIAYDSGIDLNLDFLNDSNISNILGSSSTDSPNQQINENNLENKVFKEINKAKIKSSHYINTLNSNLSDEFKINNSWIEKPLQNKRSCLLANKYRFKFIINYNMNINVIKNTWIFIDNIKYGKYESLLNFTWDNLYLNDLILAANIAIFDISTVIKWFRYKIFNDFYVRYYYAKYEFGYFSYKLCQINKISFNFNNLNNEYKLYSNENNNFYDYYVLKNKTKRYGIVYGRIY